MSGPDNPSIWVKKDTQLQADCRVFKVLKSRFSHSLREVDGDFFVIDAPDWVTVVAITPQSELVAVNQFRYGIEALSLEVPAGMVEPGEDPLETGVRELREETGFVGQHPELLGWVYPNPAIQNNRCFIVGISNAEPVTGLDWDEHEEIQTRLIPLKNIPDVLANGEFLHSLSVCALHYYFRKYPME
jgi:ADP-ribose pyrophosphatase